MSLATNLSLRSMAHHERTHKGNNEIADMLDSAADKIEQLRIALVKQTEQNAYPCSPHCAAYLREQAAQGEIERLRTELELWKARAYAEGFVPAAERNS